MTDRPNIDDLLLLWEDSLAQGKEMSPEEICRNCPELLPEIRRRIQALTAMQWMEESGGDDEELMQETILNSKYLRWMDEPGDDDEEPAAAGEPDSLGRYQLQRRIGTGGFGEVWKAYDPHLARNVAIKVPRSDRARPRDMDAFLAEARKVASLRHPGIVPVFDVGQSDGQWFIVSEFVDGMNLAEMLESRQLSPEEAARLIAEVASHLHYAHEQGFVHREPQAIEHSVGPRRETVSDGFWHRRVQARGGPSCQPAIRNIALHAAGSGFRWGQPARRQGRHL